MRWTSKDRSIYATCILPTYTQASFRPSHALFIDCGKASWNDYIISCCPPCLHEWLLWYKYYKYIYTSFESPEASFVWVLEDSKKRGVVEKVAVAKKRRGEKSIIDVTGNECSLARIVRHRSTWLDLRDSKRWEEEVLGFASGRGKFITPYSRSVAGLRYPKHCWTHREWISACPRHSTNCHLWQQREPKVAGAELVESQWNNVKQKCETQLANIGKMRQDFWCAVLEQLWIGRFAMPHK